MINTGSPINPRRYSLPEDGEFLSTPLRESKKQTSSTGAELLDTLLDIEVLVPNLENLMIISIIEKPFLPDKAHF